MKYGTLNSTLDNRSFNSLLDPDVKPTKRLERLLVKHTDESKQSMQETKSMMTHNAQSRYLKNIDLPAVVSHQTSIKKL